MTTTPDLYQTLLDLEQRLFQPDVRRSREELEKLLAEDFIEFGSSGKVFDLAAIVKELRTEREIHIVLSDFNVRLLAPGIALATYRAEVSETDDRKPTYSIRSSIWKRFGENWRMIFHQGTPMREQT